MRDVLRGVTASDRQRFFQQLAMRLFPGASSSTGISEHENDPEQPLILRISCSAPNFVDLKRHVVDVDQFTPALGLRSLYAKSATRQFPLDIDSLLFETTVFHVALPDGVTLSNAVQTTINSEFGSYSTSVKQVGLHAWEMRREFNIAMQIIQPERYAAFSQFAGRIDSIERQRLTLRINHNPQIASRSPQREPAAD